MPRGNGLTLKAPGVRGQSIDLVSLLDHRESVQIGESVEQVYDRFRHHPHEFAAVLDGETYSGLISRGHLGFLLGTRFGFTLHSRHLSQDLARQTNLLALNAAIESAKAGVHGKGFAVVAEEVRKLAEHSASAAKQIGDLITQTEEAMQEGIRTVEATDATIRTIQENITAVASASQEIGAASEQQARTSDEVARQVEDSAASTERSAAASTELAHTVEEVNRTAEYLANIAEELSSSLARFKTN